MGGRGTYASGRNVAFVYRTVGTIEGVKILEGINGKHNLPEESHTSNAYIKLDHNGIFRMMRFYDSDHYLYLEVAYHADKSLGSPDKPILHYHTYTRDFTRSLGVPLNNMTDPPLYQSIKKYLKGVDLDDQRQLR